MATMMLSEAVPLAVISQRLNYARISTSVNVYAHALPAWDRPAAETLARLLTPAQGPASGPDGAAAISTAGNRTRAMEGSRALT